MEIKVGDLFLLGTHRLLCGDAEKPEHFKLLMNNQQANMVFTDPPYNVNYSPRKGTLRKKDPSITIENDDLCGRCFEVMITKSVANLMAYTQGAFYICMSHSELPRLMKIFKEKGGIISTLLIAAKSHFSLSWAHYHPKHELILYGWHSQGKPYWCGSRKAHTLLEFKVRNRNLHPNMKPVDLIEGLLQNSSQAGDSVLDCFAGSGSTLIAAHNQNRVCYAMEISPVYCQVILDRFYEHTGIQAERG
jgi:DNA modification methylase